MTDSRVTPQAAVEAAAKAHYEYDRDVLESRWERGTWEKLEPVDRRWYMREAERALTAAVPLLCQPLQDEIDRLTQQNEQFEGRISHLRELCGIDKFSSMEGFAPEVDRLRAIVDAVEKLVDTVEHRMMATAKPAEIRAALAAVPVGTGNIEGDPA